MLNCEISWIVRLTTGQSEQAEQKGERQEFHIDLALFLGFHDCCEDSGTLAIALMPNDLVSQPFIAVALNVFLHRVINWYWDCSWGWQLELWARLNWNCPVSGFGLKNSQLRCEIGSDFTLTRDRWIDEWMPEIISINYFWPSLCPAL